MSDARLDSDALLRAISATPFIVYSCIYLVGVLCLATLSEGTIGKNYVFVDVGLCALFGGFTVLSTKALSTLLTLQWIEIFAHRFSYILLLVSPFFISVANIHLLSGPPLDWYWSNPIPQSGVNEI